MSEVQVIPASGRIKVCSVDQDEDLGTLEFSFTNGKSLVVDSRQFAESIVKRAAMHGVEQKVRDSFAGVKGDADLAFENASKVYANLLAGTWNAGRAAGTGGDSGGAAWIEAVAEIKGWTLEDARKKLGGLDDDRKKAIKTSPPVVRKVLEIKLRKAQAAIEALGAGAEAGEDLFAAL